jgi:DNA modification methylase
VSNRIEHLADGVTLYLGDCREILDQKKSEMPKNGHGADIGVVTDPPYGIDAAKSCAHSSIRDDNKWEAAEWDKRRPPDDLLRSLGAYSEAAIWGGNYFADLLPASGGWLVWRKPEAETGFSLADVELCWTNKKFAARTITLGRRDGNLHPTQKPIEVMKWTLGFIDARTILDPFMGSGTTGVAAVKLGRKFLGIEIEERYFNIAARRISEALKQPDLFIEQPKPAQQLTWDAMWSRKFDYPERI